MRFINISVAVCLALASVATQAATVPGLYQVREPLDGQGAEARTQATGKAWKPSYCA